MQSGITPIAHFVSQRYVMPKIQKIVEGWRIEPKFIIEKLVEHFREMGVYTVPFHQERLVMEDMMFQLKHSPDIGRLVARAKQEELKKQRARHPAD